MHVVHALAWFVVHASACCRPANIHSKKTKKYRQRFLTKQIASVVVRVHPRQFTVATQAQSIKSPQLTLFFVRLPSSSHLRGFVPASPREIHRPRLAAAPLTRISPGYVISACIRLAHIPRNQLRRRVTSHRSGSTIHAPPRGLPGLQTPASRPESSWQPHSSSCKAG